MACLMRCLGCLTCGIYPRFLAGIKVKMKYHTWPLRAQIMFAFFFVLGFYYVITLWDVEFISNELYELTHEKFYWDISEASANFGIRKCRDSAAQIEALVVQWDWKTNKNKQVIEEFFKSDYFVDASGNFQYPLDTSRTEIKMTDDLRNTTMQFNPEAMTYEVPKTADFPNGVINPYIEDKTRKMITLQEFWKSSLNTDYGLNHDVDLFALEVTILDPDDDCHSVFISYPGYHYSYNETDFKPGQPNCIDPNKVYADIFD